MRIGDYVLGTMPGELTVMLANYLRSKSPHDEAHTILVGYSQGHVGYMLRPEDWLMGGYEPSVTFWGPLEAEYIGEQLLALMPTVLGGTRPDMSTMSAPRVAAAQVTDNLEVDNPAPMAGTIPTTIPASTWARTGHPTQAQPLATIPRVSGLATFVWFGDDPQVKTPHVQLQFETSPGTFTTVTRKSGRLVEDGDFTIAYTPEPLQRSGPQTHVWVAEWQAVPWFGAPQDSLDDRGGVPLGRYRFHVDGAGWSLDSNPFQVVAGGLMISTPARSGGTAHATSAWVAPKGYRLMDFFLMSNQPVPLRSQAIKVDLLDGGGAVVGTANVTSDPNGAVSIADVAAATQMRLTDRFGNVATAALP